MTEADWLGYEDPRPMLEFLDGKADERRLRLFAVACCRRVWDLLTDRRSRRAVEVAERYADRAATDRELREAYAEAYNAYANAFTTRDHAANAAISVAVEQPVHAARGAANYTAYAAGDRAAGPEGLHTVPFHNAKVAERREQASVLRHIMGNPFRPVTVGPSWLSWNQGTVPRLARAIYAEQRFRDLPVLADALEEAGCDDQEVLSHCREGGEHLRGCWVVDLVRSAAVCPSRHCLTNQN
jgi:hypothetical protein